MDLLSLLRRAHANHLPHVIRLHDGSVLLSMVTSLIGGLGDTRVKVVLEAPPRERVWLLLSDIESVEQSDGCGSARLGGTGRARIRARGDVPPHTRR